nr:probable acyl-activating enzyme 16, chloroplastic [Tanacetum cinerariifolium]
MKLVNPDFWETEVKGSILTHCKAGGPFLPLVEPEVASLPLVGVGLSTSQPPLYTVEDSIGIHNPWKTVLGTVLPLPKVERLLPVLPKVKKDLRPCKGELLFLEKFLPVIVTKTDFADLNNKKRLAVCLGALFMSSSLATREDKLSKAMYNFMPLVYNYAAIAMLAPNWYDMSSAFHLSHIPLRREESFTSKASVRFVILLWVEKSSISSHTMEKNPAYSYKEIIDTGHEHRAVLADSHDARMNTGHRANGPYSGTGGTTSGDNFDNKAVVELDEKTDGQTIL